MSALSYNSEFLALPLELVAEAGIERAKKLGASWAELRVNQNSSTWSIIHDLSVEDASKTAGTTLGVRVLLDGVWGFASDPEISVNGARRAAQSAIAIAKIATPLTTRRVELEYQIGNKNVEYKSNYEIDPFEVSNKDIADLLISWNNQVLSQGAEHIDSYFMAERELKFYADSNGNRFNQERLRSLAELTATRQDMDGNPVSLRSLAQPVARGYEWLIGNHYNWSEEVSNLGELLKQKASAPLVKEGIYDLIIDPSQLWLNVHETIGHATELDRVLGYEANYAGTTFVNTSDIGTLQYGSKMLQVKADRNDQYGLASIAFDDEGVESRSFPIITDGVLVGLQADRNSANIAGLKSNGCAYAEDASYVPIQRMPNISMQPSPVGRSRNEMTSDVEDGFLIIGDDSWSIDMQRKNFQFTAQQFWKIKNGEITQMVRNAAYQSTTPKFWSALSEVGGESEYKNYGALNCGKGQPGQSAPVGHGVPVAKFDQIKVINTSESGSK